MSKYPITPLMKNINTIALFLDIYDKSNIFEMDEYNIKRIFPNNPPSVVEYMIHFIKQNKYDKDEILEKLKPILINWFNPRNGTYVREIKNLPQPRDKYILQAIDLLKDNIYVQYPN